jgi:hypothetical protein
MIGSRLKPRLADIVLITHRKSWQDWKITLVLIVKDNYQKLNSLEACFEK